MKNLLLIILTLFTINLFGQLDLNSINLNDYKEPDYKYRSLYLYFNLGGRGNINIKDVNSSNSVKGNGNTGLNLSSNCFVVKNSRKKQFSRFTHLGISPELQLRKENNKDVRDALNLYLNLNNSTYQKYYFTRKIFFETDILLHTNTNINSQLDGEKGFVQSNNELRLPLLIGFGRIENITSAWHAFRIVKDLEREGVFKQGTSFSVEDINSFSDFITNRYYTRSFDYREKFKDDIVGLRYSILKDKIDFNNPRAYASIFDIWQNGVNTIRRSGHTFALGLEPSVRYFYNKNDVMDYNVKALDLFFITRFDYARALNMKWQLDFTIELLGGVYDVLSNDSRIDDDLSDNLHPGAKSRFNFSIAYFPNTRTSFKSSIDLFGSVFYSDPDNDIVIANQSFRFTNNLYYYINSRNRLLFHFNVSNNLFYNEAFGIDRSNININFDYGIGYNLSIF